jgi:serine protease inhibitor
MKNYFTNIDLVNGTFVGTVYDASNNAEVYKTPFYGNQDHALQDINNFLQNTNNEIDDIVPTTNTVQYITMPTRRCCGG